MKIMLEQVKQIARDAGDAIMQVYNSEDFGIETKGDDSPLTKADLAAHRVIESGLKQYFPGIPQISEESQSIPYEVRREWNECFIIDPLDGTKEFIARNDEFTVNIALINQGKAVLGVIYVPVFETFYYAAEGVGAFKQLGQQAPQPISVRSLPEVDGEKHFTIVASRRHGLDKVEKLCRNFKHYDLTSRGSSLKMCLVAEGAADLYPRLAPTSEWDTAAAQAIVEQAGGKMVKTDFTPLTYNQKADILNPHFLVLGDPDFDWQGELVL